MNGIFSIERHCQSFMIQQSKWLKRLVALVLAASSVLSLVEIVNAGNTTMVPIATSGRTVMVPVFSPNCTLSDLCVTWTDRSDITVPTNYTDDPGFNYSEDGNKKHNLQTLYFYAPTAQPIRLLCITKQNQWGYVESSSNESYSSIINSYDTNGQPLNFNSAYTKWPMYQHRWPGNLLVNSSNCRATEVDMYAPVSDAYTYKHRSKSFKLRFQYPDGSFAIVSPPEEDSCRFFNQNPNRWQGALDCIVWGPDSSTLDVQVSESLTRASNYTNVSWTIDPNNAGGWKCSYKITLDGVDKGYWGNHSQAITTASWPLRFGSHRVVFKVYQCAAVCVGCTASSYVYGNNGAPDVEVNPMFSGDQYTDFNLPQP